MSLWVICKSEHIELKIFLCYLEKRVGINKIKLVIYSASDISRLNNTQIQNIIDYMNDQIYIAFQTIITIGNDLNYMTLVEMISSQANRINPTYD